NLNRGIAVPLRRALSHYMQPVKLQHGHRDLLAVLKEQPGHADLFCDNARAQHLSALLAYDCSLISTSTPAARSSFISASTVWGVGSTISSRRLCVRISNWSRDFLLTCGLRRTVNFSILF